MKFIKALFYLAILAALVVGGAIVIKKKQALDANQSKAKIYPIISKAIDTKVDNVMLTSNYIAQVKNDKEVIINTKFAGKILSIKNLGDRVQKGEVVVRLDNSDLKAKLTELSAKESSIKSTILAQKSTLNNLLASIKRTKTLLKVKMASIEELQNQQNQANTLRAQIKASQNSLKEIAANKKALRNSLSYTEIKSPVEGVVSAKFFNLGDNAFMGKPILKITPKNGNYLSLALTKDYKEIIYKGKTYQLTPLKASFSGVKLFKATIDDNSLVTGQKIEVAVVLFKGKATLLPYDSLLSINKKSYVFIYKNNKATPKEVHIIESGQEGVVIKEPLEAKILVSKPDILLKIKGGYPVKLEQ